MTELERQHKQIEIEEGLDNLSHYLDGLFRVPGTGWRFGLDALIGLIPKCRRHAHVVCVVLFFGSWRPLWRAKDNAAPNGL